MIKELFIRIKHNKDYRTRILFFCSVFITSLFAIFNAYIGISFRSIWHASIAIYFIILAIQKIYVLISTIYFVKRYKNNKETLNKRNILLYIINGFILILLVFGLSFSIIQMLKSNKPVINNEIMAISNATYAFYKIIIAIINYVKANKNDDYLIKTIRNINLSDALVSILNLTVTLETVFGGKIDEVMIIITSTLFSLIILINGVLMIVLGIINIKKFQ